VELFCACLSNDVGVVCSEKMRRINTRAVHRRRVNASSTLFYIRSCQTDKRPSLMLGSTPLAPPSSTGSIEVYATQYCARHYSQSRLRSSLHSKNLRPVTIGDSLPLSFPLKQFRGINVTRDLEDERREQDAVVATQVGAITNIVLALSKGGIGYVMQSTALIADAVHAASDLLTDAVVYFTITEARKAATPDRPWGMGKIEPLGKQLLQYATCNRILPCHCTAD
jgi:hypothetical protein